MQGALSRCQSGEPPHEIPSDEDSRGVRESAVQQEVALVPVLVAECLIGETEEGALDAPQDLAVKEVAEPSASFGSARLLQRGLRGKFLCHRDCGLIILCNCGAMRSTPTSSATTASMPTFIILHPGVTQSTFPAATIFLPLCTHNNRALHPRNSEATAPRWMPPPRHQQAQPAPTTWRTLEQRALLQ